MKTLPKDRKVYTDNKTQKAEKLLFSRSITVHKPIKTEENVLKTILSQVQGERTKPPVTSSGFAVA